jgi:hypothetical protein
MVLPAAFAGKRPLETLMTKKQIMMQRPLEAQFGHQLPQSETGFPSLAFPNKNVDNRFVGK